MDLYNTATLYNAATKCWPKGDHSTEVPLYMWVFSLQSFGALGAALGAPCAWPVSEWFGRKPALMLGGVPGVIGWLMITYCHYVPSQSGFLAILLLGRIITGFQAGWSIFCVSVSHSVLLELTSHHSSYIYLERSAEPIKFLRIKSIIIYNVHASES